MTGWKRPSLETKFHIDNEWWQSSGKDLRVAVRGQLCRDDQARFPDHRNLESVDWVDPETAEVMRADALLQTLRSHCARQPEFISSGNTRSLQHLPHLPAERQPTPHPARPRPADAVDQRGDHPAHPGQRPGLHGHPARDRAGLRRRERERLRRRRGRSFANGPREADLAMQTPLVEILVIGNEVLAGNVLDSNSHWLCQQVSARGGQVRRITVLARRPGRDRRRAARCVEPAAGADPDVRWAGANPG